MSDSDSTTDMLRSRSNPSRQYMIGKLFDYRKRLELLEAYPNKEDIGRDVKIAASRDYLDAITEVLSSKGILGKQKAFTAWHLFHRLDETLYLLMDASELKAQTVEFIQGLKRSTLPQQSITEWTAKLEEGLKKLSHVESGERERAELAFVLNSAAYVYNDYVDNLFWDIWCKKFIALIHTLFLTVAVCGLVVFTCYNEGISLCLITVLLIGAMGGLGSGILTSQPVSIAYGHFWSVTLYHAFVRPLQGAIAALMTFWLLQSQYLIAIDPPVKPGTKIIQCVKGVPCEVPVNVNLPKHGTVKILGYRCMSTATFTTISTSAQKNQAITLKAADGMQIYLYLLVLLIAGFSGDKVLKAVTDKVSNKLFADAEKTKEAK